MRALLDVNVLIALIDADHAMHPAAIAWFSDHAKLGWASTPITQNGCVRIVSHPSYANAQPVQQVIARLREATADALHEFWTDSLSLLDKNIFNTSRIHGPRQLTDIYLLALAVQHNARLVTFDGSIALAAVNDAEPKHLVKL